MAPEQAVADPGTDHRADIYAVGVLAYELLTGQPPFSGRSPQAILAAHSTETPEPLARRRPSVPSALAELVMRCLAKRPADRPQTAGEILRTLEALGASTETAAPSGSVLAAHRMIAPRWLRLAMAGLVVALLFGGLAYWRYGRGRAVLGNSRDATAGQAEATKSIAVLPFVNLSAAKENEYFADGMTEELSNTLAQIEGLRVVARTSAFQFKGKEVDVREIGQQLGVGNVLEGSVRRDGDRLRITAQLVSAKDGYHLWSETYERSMKDVFAVQEELSRAIASALQVRLTGTTGSVRTEAPTTDLAAYDLYLQGRYFWHERTFSGLTKARELFEQAIAKDPRFARAYAGLADVYVVLPLWNDIAPHQAYPRAKAAALQALALDSGLAEPQAALGEVYTFYEWDWPAADRRFQRALALDPYNANTHHWYAEDYLEPVGRLEEAVREHQHARELDPLSLTINAGLGITLYRAGRYAEALAHLENARRLDPGFILANSALGLVYLKLGRYGEAVQAFQAALDTHTRHSIDVAQLGYAYAKAGRRDDATKLLNELHARAAREYVGPTSIALLYAGLGDTTRTFQWLDRAVAARDPFLIYLFVADPLFDGLRRDPRGYVILQRMRLR